MNLTEFLLAQIAEDEATVVAVLRDRPNWDVEDSSVIDATPGAGDQLYVAHARGGYISAHIARWDPARVLAECAAKRRVIADLLAEPHVVVDDCWYTCGAASDERDGGECCDDGRRGTCDCGRDRRVNGLLRLLALPYADHPDYDEGWRR